MNLQVVDNGWSYSKCSSRSRQLWNFFSDDRQLLEQRKLEDLCSFVSEKTVVQNSKLQSVTGWSRPYFFFIVGICRRGMFVVISLSVWFSSVVLCLIFDVFRKVSCYGVQIEFVEMLFKHNSVR